LGYISEHEIRAYLVWPLLHVLGWSEQCIKFEWNHLELALLEKPYTEENKDQIPIIIGETKRLFSGLFEARKQAEDCAKEHGMKSVLVTDGGQYMLRKRNEDINDEQ